MFDKFYLVRHLINAVNDVRKMEQRALRDTDPYLLKGTRFIWLKNPDNLTDRQRDRLVELARVAGLKTMRAYMLKELFRHLWSYKRKGWAKCFLDCRFWWATHSRLKPLRDFAWMLRRATRTESEATFLMQSPGSTVPWNQSRPWLRTGSYSGVVLGSRTRTSRATLRLFDAAPILRLPDPKLVEDPVSSREERADAAERDNVSEIPTLFEPDVVQREREHDALSSGPVAPFEICNPCTKR